MKKLFILTFSLMFIFSCKNDSHKQESKTKDAYSELVNSLIPEDNIHTIEDVNSNISKINNFINFNPNHAEVENLNLVIDKLEMSKNELIFNQYKNEVSNVFNANYESYEEGISSYNNLLEISKEIQQHFKDSIKIDKIEEVLSAVNNSLSQIETEKSEYDYLINNLTSNNLNYFLEQYPNSIMKNTLLDKKDEILINEYFEYSNSSFNNIQELNSEISRLKSFMSRINSVEYKSKLKEIEQNLENNRRNILETELQDNLSRLISAMESKARSKAEGAHFNARVETCSPRGSNPEVVGYRSTFERQYLVYTKSGTWITGMKKRELIITVTGEINGDLQSGVRYNITGSRIDSDIEL